jgi:hypothetical protein
LLKRKINDRLTAKKALKSSWITKWGNHIIS